MFVAFEGIDGSGKTTISNLVAEQLTGRGLSVAHMRSKGRFASSVSEAIRTLARDSTHVELVPETEFLLYLAREVQLIHERLRPALASPRRGHHRSLPCHGGGARPQRPASARGVGARHRAHRDRGRATGSGGAGRRRSVARARAAQGGQGAQQRDQAAVAQGPGRRRTAAPPAPRLPRSGEPCTRALGGDRQRRGSRTFGRARHGADRHCAARRDAGRRSPSFAAAKPAARARARRGASTRRNRRCRSCWRGSTAGAGRSRTWRRTCSPDCGAGRSTNAGASSAELHPRSCWPVCPG